MVAVTTLSFDISVLELFGPLLTGARLVVASAEQAADPVLLADLVDAQAGDRRAGHPVHLADAARLRRPAAHRSARLVSAARRCPPTLARALLAAGLVVGNLYGPTETTIWSAQWRPSPTRTRSVSAGRSPTPTLCVLDEALRPVPVGVLGEVCLGGAGLAHGYLGRPGADRRPVPAAPLSAAGPRMYRTGDLARFAPDGVAAFDGRADDQVKLRGHRIEPGEVEAALAGHPEVTEAVVVARDERLVAYVVGRRPQPEDLRAHAARVPAGVHGAVGVRRAGRVPHTPNGKVDRAGCPIRPRR